MYINRKYKDRLFRFIFKDKKNLLDLYNAMNGSSYSDPEELDINTLEDVIYMGMKNDLSFVIDDSLNVYEHQSSFNPNMPVRGFIYVADLYRKILEGKNLYGSKLVKMPTPCYMVFYNGEKDTDDRDVLKLSDAFENKTDSACTEFKATMLNINYGHNSEIMEKCSMLNGYSQYVHKVRIYTAEMDKEEAVNRAINECIEEGNPLADLLKKHRAEVLNMTLTEYDEAKVMEQLKEESYQDGMADLIRRMLQRTDVKTISETTGISVEEIGNLIKRN